MRRSPALTRLAAAALGAALLLSGTAAPANAAAGDLGHDQSSPQCAAGAPTTGAFGIVGVTGGLPFAANPCLAAQAAWAVGTGQPGLYVNTANPGHTSIHWSPAGRLAPVRCVNPASDTDPGCAYDYGWDAALDALSVARRDAGGALDPLTVTWWLDVEGSRVPSPNGNSWKGDASSNAADLQGYVDALRVSGVREVGIYSTAFQWNDITGGYARANANAARARWPFAVKFPIEDGPVWYAGVGDLPSASAQCATLSFTGGERLLAQYLDGTIDGDVRCADADRAAPSVALLTPHSAVSLSTTIHATWRGADAGGSGLATYDVRFRRAAAHHAYSAWSYPAGWQRLNARAATLTRTPKGYTYCFSVRSRDAAGNVSAWTAAGCVARK
ncbi:MAG: hypothetical protein QOG52_1391 [Frankiaceae bacterium]|jgi:hypothetical protein|nr:hypothetical protein [Frankiaceae bacterium]